MSNKKYKPEWEGFVYKIADYQVSKNMWRFGPYIDRQDAMQEAYIIFLTLSKKYKVEKPQHFNTLFSTALRNKFIDIAKYSNGYKRNIPKEVLYENISLENGVFVEEDSNKFVHNDNNGALVVMMEQAPEEIKKVLRLFFTAPIEAVRKLVNMDERSICREVGIKAGTPIKKMMEEYFL